jgi:hypothetical protein
MSFIDQKPFTVTAEHLRLKWPSQGFRCHVCGHKFSVGDTARFVWSRHRTACPNFFTCVDCDGDDVADRAGDCYRTAVQLARQWGIYGPDWQTP